MEDRGPLWKPASRPVEGSRGARGRAPFVPGICPGEAETASPDPGCDRHDGGKLMGRRMDGAEQPRIANAAEPQRPAGDARAPYVQPRLERLGGWSALTLQHSIPIFP